MSDEQRFRDLHSVDPPQPAAFRRAWSGDRGLVWLLLARGGSALLAGLVVVTLIYQ